MNSRQLTRTLLPCILLALAVGGCCQVSPLTSFTDPDFPNPRYGRIVIHAAMENLELRRALEEAIVEECLLQGLTAYTGSMVLPPTRDWTAETEMEALKKSKADAYLRISIVGVSVHEQYVPPKTETKIEQETKVEDRGETKRIDTTEVVTTTTTGGYVQRSTTTDIRLEVIDLASGRRAWIGTTRLPFPLPRCSGDFAEKLVAQLAEDGMLP